LYRLPFYFLAFFVIPLMSFVALSAAMVRLVFSTLDVGFWNSFGQIVLTVLFLAVLAIVVRVYAVRADLTFGKAEASDAWHRISEAWPFPLEEPPSSRHVYGYMVSATGMVLISIGMCGMGLAANGLAWSIRLLSGDRNALFFAAEMPSVFVIIVGGISAIIIGLLTGVVATGAGVRLRDRGRRFRARDARTLLQRPGERPVLLLRSFDDEALADPRLMNFFQRRYEESLSRVLKRLGRSLPWGAPANRWDLPAQHVFTFLMITGSARSSI
jgi:hypothetical protein